ncbi:ankyrin repeat domain-containing protein [Chryseobacterium tructae]|uniref:Ankyrin repeat domain-containing protein n=1 Tax=Chryseobacterium tructae TaxID=1037380 RepID=A0ABV7Y0G3_9FLAO|nr:ankyrin repeat domain-containing protein [Chryseobacterium tructae]MDN3693601.1 ankyrin repeat domain-containing protein [Chryseobacterium tructae]
MRCNNIENVFQLVRINQFESLKEEVNANNVNEFINKLHQNLLQEAIVSKNYEIVTYLLNCDIDVNHSDKDGKTPLHYSIANNDFQSTQSLLKKESIEINKKDIYGNNALWVAVFHARGYYNIVKLMKQSGADSNSKNNNNKSPLDFARQIDDVELEIILLN